MKRVYKFLTILWVLALFAACNSETPVTGDPAANLGFEGVKKMIEKETAAGNFDRDAVFQGTFNLTQGDAGAFIYPRKQNLIDDTLLFTLRKVSPMANTLSVEQIKGDLKVTWTMNGGSSTTFNGTLQTDGNFRFHGPVSIKIEGGETEAYLFARGIFTEDTTKEAKHSFELTTIYLGITATTGDKQNPTHKVSLQWKATGKKATETAPEKKGLALKIRKDGRITEIIFTPNEVELSTEARQIELSAENPAAAILLAGEKGKTTLEIMSDGESVQFDQCRVRINKSGQGFAYCQDSQSDATAHLTLEKNLTPSAP